MKKGTKRPRPAFNLDRISSDFEILPSAAEINKLLQKDQEHRKEITLFVEILYVDDDLDCFIENLDDDANSEKEFPVQTRTITRDQKTVRFLCVKEGNFILLETTSLKDLFLQLDNIGHDSKIADILHNVVKNSLPQTFHTLTDGLNEIQNLMQETEKQNNPKEMTRLLTKIAKKLRSLGEFVEDHNVEDYLL